MDQGGTQEQVLSEVISTDSFMASLMRERRRVLAPPPKKGTQKKRMFQMNERGIQTGRKPEEKERAFATVAESKKKRVAHF